MRKAIYFDMDGTLADLYGVPDWLESLQAKHTKPYRTAKPMVDMRQLGRLLNQLQENGYHIGIISWLSKSADEAYAERVTKAKLDWLKRHLGSVNFDQISIIPYGNPKCSLMDIPGILFDDEKPNRDSWPGPAFDENHILEILGNLLKVSQEK